MPIWTWHSHGVWSSGYALAAIQIRSLVGERRRRISTTGNWLTPSSSVMQPVAWSLFSRSYCDSWVDLHKGKKVKWYRYRPGVAQRVGRGIALLFHDRGTRRGWEFSSTPGRTLPPGKTRNPLYRRLGGPQGQSGRAENLVPTGIRSRTVQPVVSRYTDWATGPTGRPSYSSKFRRAISFHWRFASRTLSPLQRSRQRVSPWPLTFDPSGLTAAFGTALAFIGMFRSSLCGRVGVVLLGKVLVFNTKINWEALGG